MAPSGAPDGRGSFSLPSSGGDLPLRWGRATTGNLGTNEAECTDFFPDRASPVPAQAWDGPGGHLGPSQCSGGPQRWRGTSFSRSASFTGTSSLRRASSLRGRVAPFGRPSVLDAALMPLRSITVQSSSGEDKIAALQRVQQQVRGSNIFTPIRYDSYLMSSDNINARQA